MDQRDNFQDWTKTVQEWINDKPAEQISKQHSQIKPNMYNICIKYNSEAPDEIYNNIFMYVFNIIDENVKKSLDEIKLSKEISIGVFTREVGEHKKILIISQANKAKYNIKCILIKEDQYVIKKS